MTGALCQVPDNRPPEGYASMIAAFRAGLRETGFIEAQNVVIEYRWGKWPIRQITSPCGRSSPPRGCRDSRDLHCWRNSGKGSHHKNSHRLHHQR
jgi:hypothetical protein